MESGGFTHRWWRRFGGVGQADGDLFVSQENAQCPHLSGVSTPLGVDALAHLWPNVLLYTFLSLSLISPALARVQKQGLSLILVAPRWPSKHWKMDNPTSGGQTMVTPHSQGPSFPSTWRDLSFSPRPSVPLGLACKR